MGPKNIRVNSIAPGAIVTEGTQTYFQGELSVENIIKTTPLKRIGYPVDVAKAAVYLASDDAVFITDSRIVISGGVK